MDININLGIAGSHRTGDDDVVKSITLATFNTETTNGTLNPYGATSVAVYLTDSPYTKVWDGTAWDSYVNGVYVVPPVTTGFTDINSPTEVLTTSGGVLLRVAHNATLQIRGSYVAAPDTPWTLEAAYMHNLVPSGYAWAGIGAQAADGKQILAYAGWTNSGGWRYEVDKWDDNAATNGAAAGTNSANMLPPVVWQKITYDGTTLAAYFGPSRHAMHLLASFNPVSTYGVTPARLTRFCACTSGTGTSAYQHLLHWAVS